MESKLRLKASQIEILRYLREHLQSSRVDIATQINLTKAAVTGMINEMLEIGILKEQGELLAEAKNRSRGRRKVIIKINENYRLALGATVLNNTLVTGLTNLSGGVLDHTRRELSAQATHRSMLEAIVEDTTKLLKENCITMERISSLGICLDKTAPEGNSDGVLLRVKKDISHAVPVPVTAVTLAQGAICAQSLFCEKEDSKSMLMLHHGQNLECAFLANGRLFKGAHGAVGGFSQQETIPFFNLSANAADGLDAQMNDLFAKTISQRADVLDPEKIYAFGGYFETKFGITHINLLMSEGRELHTIISAPVLADKTAFLAGCAAGIEEQFFGGFILR